MGNKLQARTYINLLFFFFCFSLAFADSGQGVSRMKVVYISGGYLDPFVDWLPREVKDDQAAARPERPDRETITLPTLSIQGTIWGGVFPQAIINGSVVKEGDKVQGAKVLKITKDRVKLLYKSKIFFLVNRSKDKGRPR